jgi:chromosome segregation ATPase
MSQMQEIAAAVWSDLGIERGERKSERIARGDDADKIYHRGVKQLHEDLPKEIKSLQDQVKSLELDRAWIDEQITQMGLEESARLQVAMARNSKLEAEIERKTGLLSSLNSSVTEMEAKKESLESRSSESQKRLKELEEAVLESQTKLDKNLRLIDGAQEKLESLLASADSIEERVKKAEKNLSIYEKRAQDAQKELEKARQEIEDITKAMAAVEPLESIQEPTVEEVEIISERKLMTTKIQRVKAVDASDMRDYIQKVTARESAIMSNAMSKAFAKAKGLDARERQIEWRECQLDEREEKLTKREKAITQREAELGINKQKQKQLGIEL